MRGCAYFPGMLHVSALWAGRLAGGPTCLPVQLGSVPLTIHFCRRISWMWLSSRPGVLQTAALPN